MDRITCSRRRFLQRSLALGGGAWVARSLPSMMAIDGEHAGERAPEQANVQLGRTPQTLREKVGQLCVVSFGGTALDARLTDLLERITPGGVILYARNCPSAAAVRSLLAQL